MYPIISVMSTHLKTCIDWELGKYNEQWWWHEQPILVYITVSGVHVVCFIQLHVFTFLVQGCDVLCDFHVEAMFNTSHLFCRGFNVLFMLFVFICIYWCPAWFPYQMMFVLFNSKTAGTTIGAETCGSCCSILSFLCSILTTIVYLFLPLLLAIVLSVLAAFDIVKGLDRERDQICPYQPKLITPIGQ